MKPILCILGKSGSGKTTICNELEKRCGLKAIPSYTTRPKRYDDETGHIFITEQEFDDLKDILAYAKTDGYRYAVTKKMFEDEQYSIYVIDMSGLKYLLDTYKGKRIIVSVYIDTNDDDCFEHMINRNDDRNDDEKILAAIERMNHDAVEFNKDDLCDYVNFIISNFEGHFDSTLAMVKRICENYGILGGITNGY